MNSNTKKIRETILELCSEDAYGSWELWPSKTKTKIESVQILDTIEQLIKENKLVALEYNPVNNSYQEVVLDISRLEDELTRSMVSDVDSDKFYWFETTDSGKKEYEAWAKEYWTEERVAKEKEKWRRTV